MSNRELTQLKKQIKTIQWYRQGGLVSHYFVPWRAILPVGGFCIGYYKGEHNYTYFDKEHERKFAYRVIQKQMKNPEYLYGRFVRPWLRWRETQNKFLDQLVIGSFPLLAEREFLKFHDKLFKLRYLIWRYGIMIEPFDPWGSVIIDRYFQKNNIKVPSADLAVLTGTCHLTFLERERIDLLRLTQKALTGISIGSLLEEHTRKYHWLNNSWSVVERLDVAYFKRRVKQAARQGKTKIANELRKLTAKEVRLRRQRLILIRKYHLPQELCNLVDFFSTLTDWRDERKEQVLKVNVYADHFLSEFSRRTRIVKRILGYLDPSEIISIGHVKKLRSNLVKRRRSALCWFNEKEEIHWLTGPAVFSMHALLEKRISSGEIEGTAAYQGVVKGRVCKIMSVSDFAKIRQGDVLVTQMTRPDFMPVIRKAAAIVTDEGGITCHAAVISREFKIPCIIGTQTATTILKDGDRVEVDAERGIVKKLSSVREKK